MTRQDFLLRLRSGLAGNVPAEEAARLVDYYDEMILDLMEDGRSEADAVAQVGDPNDLVYAAAGTRPLPAPSPTSTLTRRRWRWTLLILGAPLWGSLLLAAACILLSADLILWCVPLTGAGVSFGFLLGGAISVIASPLAVSGAWALALVELGAGFILLGLGMIVVWLTVQITRICWRGHRALFQWGLAQLGRSKAVIA
ncbi:DUF1700 domain-containing protein [Lacticaseibacillus absianus]|uniref:DUF1700 domain-containing protein n=1 Tax=Lacticaseibacillus absianus TaxID=2729623 RepID=UPI0015CB1194|nr:hypothetical protein [Lacticaseibacillus absianus]